MANVCVFCGANPGNDPVLAETAAELGRSLAMAGHRMVYGGGRVGLMGIVADAALETGGEVIGFIPKALADREVAHRDLTELVITDTMHTRKQSMCDRSDGVITLPGGFGTLDEVMEMLTWNQIGTVSMPVAFLDVNGYYESLFRFFDEAVGAGLIMPAHRRMAQRSTSVDEAIQIATGPAPSSPSKWTDPSIR